MTQVVITQGPAAHEPGPACSRVHVLRPCDASAACCCHPQTVGHGDLLNFNIASEEDIWGFSGPIATQQQLVRVLTTIAFTASAHHAAVNFGQYDFSGLILNFSSMVRKPMPSKGDKAWQVGRCLARGWWRRGWGLVLLRRA